MPSLALKYALDRLVAVVLLLLLAPVFLLILVAMVLEMFLFPSARGPFFFREKRISRGTTFSLIKFRIIRQEALAGLPPGQSIWRLQWDPKNRTRVGSIIFRVYFDELPQLWNILKGEMSLVGPRPKTPLEYEALRARGFVSLKYLKGGLTGLHQIHKGNPNFSVRLSEIYLKKCRSLNSIQLFGMDTAILIRSFLKVLKAEGL